MLELLNKVTLVMAYYRNPMMLEHHYSQLRTLPEDFKSHIRVIIVDDGSPEKQAVPPTSENALGIDLEIYRMVKDIRWNQDACRNLGVDRARTDWVLLTDMDHLVPKETWTYVLSSRLSERRAYRFARVTAPDMTQYKPHPNSWLVRKHIYELAGGYDERFAGFYGTDGMFASRLAAIVSDILPLPVPLVRYPREYVPDASTTHYERKTPEDRDGMAKVKAHILKLPLEQQRPKRLTQEWVKVFPK